MWRFLSGVLPLWQAVAVQPGVVSDADLAHELHAVLYELKVAT